MSRRHAPRPVVECWCCGEDAPHQGRGLCKACYMRWRRRGFTGPGPGPSERQPITDNAREYATYLTAMTAREAGERLGRSARTVQRWQAALRQAALT